MIKLDLNVFEMNILLCLGVRLPGQYSAAPLTSVRPLHPVVYVIQLIDRAWQHAYLHFRLGACSTIFQPWSTKTYILRECKLMLLS